MTLRSVSCEAVSRVSINNAGEREGRERKTNLLEDSLVSALHGRKGRRRRTKSQQPGSEEGEGKSEEERTLSGW
jgi:hypothetical protein